ncbi:MAG TPA: hypothetical protein DDW99_07360, partial [Ruminococcaceae bacterium]|nr:hypothetical protein [Oscillospiraceae bacterium]
DKMNAKAAALGLKDTHFVTPSGLDDGGCNRKHLGPIKGPV